MWYAVQTQTGSEDATLKQLLLAADQAGIADAIQDAFVPKRVVVEGQLAHAKRVEKPLFPGYLIVAAKRKDVQKVARMTRQIKRFARVLATDGVFVPLQPEEEALIKALTGAAHVVGVSEGFVEGGRVTVVSGPLLGLETTIVKLMRRKRMARVELTFCGRTIQTDLALEVMKCHKPAKAPASEQPAPPRPTT